MSREYDALLAMGGTDMLRGFVLSTLNKIPKVTPDIVETDKKWKNWDMEVLINKLCPGSG